jgi:hypothetical protein
MSTTPTSTCPPSTCPGDPVNATAYYLKLLNDIAVGMGEIKKARTKRNELAAVAVAALNAWGFTTTGFFASGALAAGTQIKPLNDVDVVVYAGTIRVTWKGVPRQALVDLCAALRAKGYECTISTHAIKVTFPDVAFTADVVFGCTHPEQGLWIPHCPDDEPHEWIRTDPREHARQIRQRNKDIGVEFARELRILKVLNRKWGLSDPDGRKPISSHHLNALALAIIHTPVAYTTTTPVFLDRAAELVRRPLPDPSGVGPDLEARDPERAAALMRTAAAETRRALDAGDDAGRILEGVFGDPATTLGAVAGAPISIAAGGALTAGSGSRSVGSGRSYGDAA